jgi:Tol biopolymer transport system component
MTRLLPPLVVAVLVAAGAGSATPGAEAELAFDRDGRIWIVGLDGSGLRAVTRGYTPKWSFDGQRLAFVRELGRNAEIFTADADGGTCDA